MRKRTLLGIPLAVMMGVTACSGGTTTMPNVATTVATTSTAVVAPGTGLDGVEFIIHQAPG